MGVFGQAETVEDVDDWKEALERAFEAAAPNAGLVVDHDTAFRNETHDAFEGLPQHGEHGDSTTVIYGDE